MIDYILYKTSSKTQQIVGAGGDSRGIQFGSVRDHCSLGFAYFHVFDSHWAWVDNLGGDENGAGSPAIRTTSIVRTYSTSISLYEGGLWALVASLRDLRRMWSFAASPTRT
jgi:hypothetical protein